MPFDDNIVEALISELNELVESYDAFLTKQDSGAAANILFKADSLSVGVDRLRGHLYSMERALRLEAVPPVESSTLSVYMPAELNFGEFIERLNAVEKIYSELCQLLNVSEAQEPLKIAKVESGSLWAKVFGNSKVISLMDDFIRASAKFMHRNYTKEGKTSSVSSKLETLNQVLEFSDKLKAAGLDVTEMRDSLAKSGHEVAKQLNCLLSNHPFVTVNDDQLPLVNRNDIPQLENREPPRLSNDT